MNKKNRYVYRYVSSDKKIFKLVPYFIIFGAMIGFIYFSSKKIIGIVYNSDKIIIKNIEISGTNNVTKAEIRELLPFKIGDNLLKINLSDAENEIKKLKPELKNIIITRRWQKIKIKLYERTPEAFIIRNNEVLGIDFDNSPFPLRGFMSTMKIPKIFYKSSRERIELLNFIKKSKLISGNFFNNISEIKFNNTRDIIFVMRDATIIFWGNEAQEYLSCKFKNFQKVYVDAMSKYERLEYIDMTLYSFGKAIVKPIVE
jgi:cell division protein FtsQ